MEGKLLRIYPAAARTAVLLGLMSIALPLRAHEFAYAGNERSGTLSVIDIAGDNVVRTVPDSGKIAAKLQAIVVDRAQKNAYVVDAVADALVVVDLKSGQVERRINVGKSPEGASLSPSGKTIAVCVEDDNSVALVDVGTSAVTQKIPTKGKNPEHCAFSSDGRWLLTSNENSDDVDLIDLKTLRSVALIHTSGHPRGIAWLPHQPIAYVAQEQSGGVDVVDTAKRAILASIPTGLRPAGALSSADGAQVFVSNGGDGNVAVIDTATRQVVAKIPVGKRPWNMALSHDGKKLYVANGRSNSVSVIDTHARSVIKEISVGEMPWGVDIP